MIYLGHVTSISLLGERSLVQRMGVRAESWEREGEGEGEEERGRPRRKGKGRRKENKVV